jgi:hypothetical protein
MPIENMDIAWVDFKQREKESWVASKRTPKPEALLVKPSGSLNSPLCHHLHHPSYNTEILENGEVADWTNGCIVMVMGMRIRQARLYSSTTYIRENHNHTACENIRRVF